jgi:hypothetical protein
MIVQKQPNSWSCLPTAFGIVLGIPVDRVIKSIGHDGSEIINHDLEDPYRRKGFHIQEIIDISYRLRKAMIPIQAIPMLATYSNHNNYQIFDSTSCRSRLSNYLEESNGILTGETVQTRKKHAVAWNGKEKMIYDPNGSTYDITRFMIETFWIVTDLRKEV